MRILVCLLAVIAVCGCSVHPLPDRVTGLETHLIVQKIRCEAQDALKAIFEGNAVSPNLYRGGLAKFRATSPLEKRSARERKEGFEQASAKIKETQKNRKELNEEGMRGADKRADLRTREREIKLKVEELEAYISDLKKEATERKKKGEDPVVVDRDILKRATAATERVARQSSQFERDVRKFKSAVFAYDKKVVDTDRSIKKLQNQRKKDYGDILVFLGHQLTMQVKFSITEKNTGKLDSSFKIPILLGTVQIDPSTGDERERLGERTIKMAADFKDLLDEAEKEANRKACDDLRPPVHSVGPAPRYPIVGQVGLAEAIEQFLQISEQAKDVFLPGAKASSEAYTHKIQFKTTVSAGIKPKVTISQATGHSITGTLDLSGSRVDVHEVLVGLYDEKEKDASEADKITKVQIVREADY